MKNLYKEVDDSAKNFEKKEPPTEEMKQEQPTEKQEPSNEEMEEEATLAPAPVLSERRKALFEPLEPIINTNGKRPSADSLLPPPDFDEASYPRGWLVGKKRKLVNVDVVESMRRIAVQEMNRKVNLFNIPLSLQYVTNISASVCESEDMFWWCGDVSLVHYLALTFL